MAKNDQFWAWVEEEIEARDLSYHAIERLARLSNAAVSKPARSRTAPSTLVCVGIAQVFGLTPESVMRRAGLLPPVPPAVEEEEELVQVFRRLPPNVRSILVLMVRALRPLQSPPPPVRSVEAVRARREDDDDDLLSRQLIEAFLDLPPGLQRIAMDEVEQAQQHMASLARIIGLEEDQTDYDQAPREEAAGSQD